MSFKLRATKQVVWCWRIGLHLLTVLKKSIVLFKIITQLLECLIKVLTSKLFCLVVINSKKIVLVSDRINSSHFRLTRPLFIKFSFSSVKSVKNFKREKRSPFGKFSFISLWSSFLSQKASKQKIKLH